MSVRPWYPVSREFWEHPDWRDRSPAEITAWLYLLAVTRWRDGDGILRGQARVTQAELARRAQASSSAMNKWVKRWERVGAITYTVERDEADRATGMVVTVCNYEKWAAREHEHGAEDGRADGSATGSADGNANGRAENNAVIDISDERGRADGSATGSADGKAAVETSCIGHDLKHVEEQQRAHAREAAAAADPSLSWDAVRDLWVETWSSYYKGTPTMKLGGPHLGPIAFVAERLAELAAEVGVDDAVAHVAAVFEAYLEDKEHWLLVNRHPLAWLTKADESSTEPRWHQWAMRDPWYAARQSHSHHVAQSEAPSTSTTSEQAAQSHSHHVADPSLPTYPRATGEDADEVREVLQQLVNDGLDAIKTGVLCRVGADLALVFADDMDMLLSAKRVARYLPDVACLHGAVEREQRGMA